MRWTIKSASEAVGGLSNPSKMPGLGTSTPSDACPIGSRLAKIPGTVCSGCYAAKGSYTWQNVQTALERRLAIVRACEGDPIAAERWIEAMSFLLNTRRDKWRPGAPQDHRFFRWHDSGDLQGVYHLGMIDGVAARTPRVAHWLPTREIPTVLAYRRRMGGWAPNLVVRVSAAKVDARAPRIEGCAGSAVHSILGAPPEGATECGAVYTDNACGDCRACWNPNSTISYHKH